MPELSDQAPCADQAVTVLADASVETTTRWDRHMSEAIAATYRDGWRRMRHPGGESGWRERLALVYVLLLALDALTTSVLVTSPDGVAEANPFAAAGQSSIGVIAYCVVMSVVLLVLVVPLLLGRNVTGRHAGHVALGLGLIGVAVKLSAVVNNFVTVATVLRLHQ